MNDELWEGVPIYREEADVPRPSRRRILGGALTLMGATAFGVIAGVRSARPADASGTEYGHCVGFDTWEGYDDNSAVCLGGDYATSWCGPDGWFRRASGTCFNQWPVSVCGVGTNNPGRNAWRWTSNGAPYRCADGRIQTCGTDAVDKICAWPNPSPP